jgi:hypothetical protein
MRSDSPAQAGYTHFLDELVERWIVREHSGQLKPSNRGHPCVIVSIGLHTNQDGYFHAILTHSEL